MLKYIKDKNSKIISGARIKLKDFNSISDLNIYLDKSTKKIGGVYVFFDDSTPIYVGETKDLNRRIKEYKKGRIKDSRLLVNLMKSKKESLICLTNEKIIQQFDKKSIKKEDSVLMEKMQNRINDFFVCVVREDDKIKRMIIESYYSLAYESKYNGINYSLLGIYGLLPVK